MHKRELIMAITSKLHDYNRKKPIRVQKHKFYISDSAGNKAEFEISDKDMNVSYTSDDVAYFLEAAMDVIVDALQKGDEVSVSGFGNLKLHHRAARKTKRPDTGEEVFVDARLVPKFFFGSRLRMAARAFELLKAESDASSEMQEPIYDEDDT